MSETPAAAPIKPMHPGAIIQILPPHEWAGSLWIVDEPREWGVVAYCIIPGREGIAFIRLAWGKFTLVGEHAAIECALLYTKLEAGADGRD